MNRSVQSFIKFFSILGLTALPSVCLADPGVPLASLGMDVIHNDDSLFHIWNGSETVIDHKTANPGPGKSKKSKQESREITIPGFAQDLGLLKSLENAGPFHIKAALSVMGDISRRHLNLLDYRFSDTNGDLGQEIVVLSRSDNDDGKSEHVISIYDFDRELGPQLKYETRQTLIPNQFHQQIQAAKKGFRVCDDWNIASWVIHECHHLQLDMGWNARVISHEIETSDPSTHSSQRNTFHFGTRTASREYTRLPEGSFMPALSRRSQYTMIFAEMDPGLEAAPVSLETPNSTAFSDHQPFRFGAHWNPAGVYFSFDFSDLDVHTSQTCSDTISIQQVDHAELWFDLNPTLSIDRQNPESWQLQYQKDYQNEPYRHAIDSDIFGLAVTPDGCLVPMTPTREHWTDLPQVSTHSTASGYHIDVFIPAHFFGVDNMSEMHRALGLGFTAHQHDFHGDHHFSSADSSEFHWPDPFTFGQVWLLPPEAAYPPLYPLQWNTWLEQ